MANLSDFDRAQRSRTKGTGVRSQPGSRGARDQVRIQRDVVRIGPKVRGRLGRHLSMALQQRFAYVMVGRIYKVARILSERDGVCVVVLDDDHGDTSRFEAPRGVDPQSGLPLVLESGPRLRELTA